jgi:hypothetical protein
LRFDPRLGKLAGVEERLGPLLERIDRGRRQADASPIGAATRNAIEDLLTEGYIVALSCESTSRRLDERLRSLAESLEDDGAAREARRLALQKRTLDSRVSDLRERLADLRERLRLGTAQCSDARR